MNRKIRTREINFDLVSYQTIKFKKKNEMRKYDVIDSTTDYDRLPRRYMQNLL